MTRFRNTIIRAGLSALYLTRAHHALRPICAGVGTIFMLHHVRPARDDAFQPNRHLEVTPEFLRATLVHLREQDIDLVDLDEAHRRLTERDFSRRFACFTLDDGYRDNRDFALPVFQAFDAPFTVYVTREFADGGGAEATAPCPSSPPRRFSTGTRTSSKKSSAVSMVFCPILSSNLTR